MKSLMEIDQQVQKLKANIQTLQTEIIDVLDYQRKQGLRPNKDCDAITGREIRIAIIEGEIRGLKWVVGE